jgi:outer membrane lipoprotein
LALQPSPRKLKKESKQGIAMKRKRAYVKPISTFMLCAMIGIVLSSCSVMSREMRREAIQDVTFDALKRNTQDYQGETVIFGGYILETRNLTKETRLLVLQAPLSVRDEPKDRDLSRGRFVVIHDGFLDPAIYKHGRKVTVAGEVVGEEQAELNDHRFTMPVIRSREIFLWKEQTGPVGYHYYDPFYPWPDPYFRHRPGFYRW